MTTKKPKKPKFDIDPENPCDGCPIRCSRHKSKAKIKKNAPFLVVAKAPSKESLRLGRTMPKRTQEKFLDCMEQAGLPEDMFSWANAVRCEFDPDLYDRHEKAEIKARCRYHLLEVIEHAKPEAIVPAGKDATDQVIGKSVKITKVRGLVQESDEYTPKVVPVTDPTVVNMFPQNLPILQSDCDSLGRLYEYDYDIEESEKDAFGQYEQVYDLQFLIDMAAKEIAFDVETLGNKPYRHDTKIMTMQFCVEPGTAYLLSWDHPDDPMPKRDRKRIRRQLIQLLCRRDCDVIGQNLKFDVEFLWCKLGIRVRVGHDTNMLAAIVDENLMSKDLDTLTKIYAPEMAGYADRFNATYDKSRMDLVPLEEIITYGSGDTDAAMRVYKTLRPLAEADERQWASYRYVSIAGLNAFASFETNGMLIDEEELDTFQEVLTEQVAEEYDSLIKQVHREIRRQWTDPKKPQMGLSFSRPDFTRDVLFTHKKGFKLKPIVFTKSTQKLEKERQVPSISTKDHLPFFYDNCPFALELSDYIKNERVLTSNVISFREKYLYRGKIYPVYGLSVAVTGRTNSRDPNGQNFPKRGKAAKAYRKTFVAPEGYVQLECDLSQAELRISADMANERRMLQIYRNDGDVHLSTACMVMGITEKQFMQLEPDERKLARFRAKAVNFGFIYGMWWKKFVAYAKTQYGVEFTDAEAKAVREGFFALYPGLAEWHEGMRRFAKRNGYVRSYDGRVRHLPAVNSDEDFIQQEALRQAINSPVQEFASSLGVMSMSRVTTQINPEYLRLTGFVHDALYALVPMEYAEWGAKTLKYYMESNPIREWFGTRLKVPIKADVGFGLNAAEIHEMETLDLDKRYDFGVHADDMDFTLPRQKTPPNDGRLILPPHLQAPEEIHLWD